MSKPESLPLSAFQSCLAPWLSLFIQEKRASGFRYTTRVYYLRDLDVFLQKEGVKTPELSRTIIELWLTSRPYYQKPQTVALRRSLVRQLALFLIRNNVPAYVPSCKEGPIVHYDYAPWIFSHHDIQKLLAAADSLPFCSYAPLRHRIVPEVFRLLYGCGLRINEALQLRVQDVDLVSGLLILKEAKGNKDRLVPLAPSVRDRLCRYAKKLGSRSPDVPFFPAPDGGFYSRIQMYSYFRQFLWQTGISHGGRGQGPRLHDIRHTMACHRLIEWYREGADLNAKLPILATYLGHKHLSGTQRYLHLSSELYSELTLKLESSVGHVIPQRSTP
jgi:integrase/recombinase XerD